MNVAVITWPEFFERETEAVEALFEAGLEVLHLRKPRAGAESLKQFVEKIDTRFHPRITVHGRPATLQDLDVGGFHIPKDVGGFHIPKAELQAGTGGQLTEKRLSCSCHSLEEIRPSLVSCKYVFLSPIFNSISKSGYGAAFPAEELAAGQRAGIITQQVYALGGITPERLGQVRAWGFGGVGILGYIWEPFTADKNLNALVERYSRLVTNASKEKVRF
jgi:thiamine-phosphate pyrophosphorylase